MKETILFVEDDNSIFSFLKAIFELNGYGSEGFIEPLSFLEAIKTRTPDLVVLDLMLPHMSGYDVLKSMRNDSRLAEIPVIILSAMSNEIDIVRGFEYGAVDYVTKPFGILEFISRIKANLRKRSVPQSSVFKVRNLIINRDTLICTVEGKRVSLTAKEFELVAVLAENSPKVMGHAELLKKIWGYESDIETRTLDMHIKTAREKISRVTSEQYISTVRSVGYVIYDEVHK